MKYICLDGATHTGRGPNGRPRNFRAMSDQKFRIVYKAVVVYEANDPQCVALLQNERDRRGFIDRGDGVLHDTPKEPWEVVLDVLSE